MNSFQRQIQEQNKYYRALGFDTLPLQAASKTPEGGMEHWHQRIPEVMWQHAKPDSNIGIRCGGIRRLLVVDCDEKHAPGTFDNVLSVLDDLGMNTSGLPIVQTASGIGKHIYLQANCLVEGHLVQVHPSIGAGEIRFGPGAYVVAPPSFVESPYSLIQGCFEELSPVSSRQLIKEIARKDIPLQEKNFALTELAIQLLTTASWKKEYKSRSEAECAVMNSLINAGFDYQDILEIFKAHNYPGKYAALLRKNPKEALHYFNRTYQSAEVYCKNHVSEGRRIGKLVGNYAAKEPFKGKTGATDRAVLLALAEIAYRSGKQRFTASHREISIAANISKNTSVTAIKRLETHGLIHRLQSSNPSDTSRYCFSNALLDKIGTYPHIDTVRECTNLFPQDAFRWGALNKSGCEIYICLEERPMTIKELAQRTGRHARTVKKTLKRMREIVNSRTGEILELVEQEEGKWRLNKRYTLHDVAIALGAFGKTQLKKHTYEQERRMFLKGKHR